MVELARQTHPTPCHGSCLRGVLAGGAARAEESRGELWGGPKKVLAAGEGWVVVGSLGVAWLSPAARSPVPVLTKIWVL